MVRMQHPGFLIVGLPRSRTAWLAAFLTDGLVTCHHELIRDCQSTAEYIQKFKGTHAPVVGDSDCCIPFFYSKVRAILPPHRICFVKRDESAARESAQQFTSEHNIPEVEGRWEKCVELFNLMREANPAAPTYNFEDLDDPGTMKALTEYCTGFEFNRERFDIFNTLRVNIIPQKSYTLHRALSAVAQF